LFSKIEFVKQLFSVSKKGENPKRFTSPLPPTPIEELYIYVEKFAERKNWNINIEI